MRKKSEAPNGTSLLKLDSLIAVLQVHPVIVMFWPKQFLVVVQFRLASEVVLLQPDHGQQAQDDKDDDNPGQDTVTEGHIVFPEPTGDPVTQT